MAEKEEVVDDLKRVRMELMAERDRATVKMSGWMQVRLSSAYSCNPYGEPLLQL